MEILQYNDLDVSSVRKVFDRTVQALRAGEFRAADVRKMKGAPYYRAKLNDADRLLFRFGAYAGKTYLLLLEIIYGHAYDRSRFLNGATVDEAKLESVPGPEALREQDTPALTYVNPNSARFHFLDKILSFDDCQAEAYGLPTPLILIGSAGSGKTVLVLEKLKNLHGDVLYVTRSAYLAENARNLYYAFGYENERQQIDFLSLQEYVESLHVPRGQPITFGAFNAWFSRHGHGTGVNDSHMLFEEFNGVLTGMAIDKPCLECDEYIGLGIRQSIIPVEQRSLVYDLFRRYLDWLDTSEWYDPNVIAYRYLSRCVPRYDFVVVDEVQDITNIQLHLILKSLRNPENFALCGDSNQIVHPNFFSWAKVKTMFYEQRLKGRGEIRRVLNANYRNSSRVTDLSNRLLLIKNARFGSIDRESNYLVTDVSERPGTVELASNDEKTRRALDAKTSRSTRFAVLVMRAEDKEKARRQFRTPLVFSVQEAKGLEYDSIILIDFVSGNAREFDEVIAGVSTDALNSTLRYARAKDKADKSLEAYKFYTNALYVALTRAVSNVYILESNTRHRLWRLMDLKLEATEVKVKADVSSDEEWKEEAHKLDLQGKTEQADAIRRTILAIKEVPWRVLTADTLEDLKREALDPANYNRQAKLQLFEYALVYHVPYLFEELARHGFKRAANPLQDLRKAGEKSHKDYHDPKCQELNRQIDLYGVDFRNPLNQTPLMIAAQVGRADLARALLKSGAQREATDNWGRNSLHIAIRAAYHSQEYARERIGEIYPLLAPTSIKVKVDGRMIKIDQKHMEFFVLQSMIAVFQDIARVKTRFGLPAFETGDFLHALSHFTEHVIPARRKKRPYLSSILSKNEVNRQDPCNRKLFVRLQRGRYILNPLLEIEIRGVWTNVYDLIGISTLEKEDAAADGQAYRLHAVLGFVRKYQARAAAENRDVPADADPPHPQAAPTLDNYF